MKAPGTGANYQSGHLFPETKKKLWKDLWTLCTYALHCSVRLVLAESLCTWEVLEKRWDLLLQL